MCTLFTFFYLPCPELWLELSQVNYQRLFSLRLSGNNCSLTQKKNTHANADWGASARLNRTPSNIHRWILIVALVLVFHPSWMWHGQPVEIHNRWIKAVLASLSSPSSVFLSFTWLFHSQNKPQFCCSFTVMFYVSYLSVLKGFFVMAELI